MKLAEKEKALEDLRVVVEGGFKGIESILAIQGQVVKATGDISNVRYTEYDPIKAVDIKNATILINLLLNETELAKVRDDIDEDGSITYTFIVESSITMLVVELMIVWKDKR